MATYRINKDKDNPYVMMNKEFIQNPYLSMQAKGLLAYFLSLPNDWEIRRTELTGHFSNGIRSISNVINELIKAGYITRVQTRKENNCFGEVRYDVFEIPQLPGKAADTFPQRGFP
ncbi:MAG: helix-turn-helix domain-containing protein [Victivallales bacterium]|nr:helix-turn-helix domain-containing protein [Victivallales bacterium]MCF7889430.1 helix-turn-helix domain-containing protein [Victivallales bacterium]